MIPLQSKILIESLILTNSNLEKDTIPNGIAHAYWRVRESKCVCTRMRVYAPCVHDLYAFTSRDFALTQCQRPVVHGSQRERFLGLGLPRAFTPLTLLTHLPYCTRPMAALVCASLLTTFHESDEESRSASAYANYDPRARGQEASLLIVSRCNPARFSHNTETTVVHRPLCKIVQFHKVQRCDFET